MTSNAPILQGAWMRGGSCAQPTLAIPPLRHPRAPSSATCHYVSSDNTSNVFAVQTLRGTVRRVGAEGALDASWRRGIQNPRHGDSADADLSRDLVQLTVSPDGWVLSSNRNTATPRSLAQGEFNPPLAVNGTYRLEMDAADGSVIVRGFPDQGRGQGRHPRLLSGRVYWQHVATPAELPIGQNSASTWCGPLSKANRSRRSCRMSSAIWVR